MNPRRASQRRPSPGSTGANATFVDSGFGGLSDTATHAALLRTVASDARITTTDGTVFEGVFTGTEAASGELSLILRYASVVSGDKSKISLGENRRGAVVDRLAIPSKIFVRMDAPPLSELSSATAQAPRGFALDTEISARAAIGPGRELKRFDDFSAPPPVRGTTGNKDVDAFGDIAMGGRAAKWDQFQANATKFGVTASFDEEEYTTKIDTNSKKFRSREREAARLAAEIEGGVSANVHVMEERGQTVEGGGDEEDRYSGVRRTTTAGTTRQASPPARQSSPPARQGVPMARQASPPGPKPAAAKGPGGAWKTPKTKPAQKAQGGPKASAQKAAPTAAQAPAGAAAGKQKPDAAKAGPAAAKPKGGSNGGPLRPQAPAIPPPKPTAPAAAAPRLSYAAAAGAKKAAPEPAAAAGGSDGTKARSVNGGRSPPAHAALSLETATPPEIQRPEIQRTFHEFKKKQESSKTRETVTNELKMFSSELKIDDVPSTRAVGKGKGKGAKGSPGASKGKTDHHQPKTDAAKGEQGKTDDAGSQAPSQAASKAASAASTNRKSFKMKLNPNATEWAPPAGGAPAGNTAVANAQGGHQVQTQYGYPVHEQPASMQAQYAYPPPGEMDPHQHYGMGGYGVPAVEAGNMPYAMHGMPATAGGYPVMQMPGYAYGRAPAPAAFMVPPPGNQARFPAAGQVYPGMPMPIMTGGPAPGMPAGPGMPPQGMQHHPHPHHHHRGYQPPPQPQHFFDGNGRQYLSAHPAHPGGGVMPAAYGGQGGRQHGRGRMGKGRGGGRHSYHGGVDYGAVQGHGGQGRPWVPVAQGEKEASGDARRGGKTTAGAPAGSPVHTGQQTVGAEGSQHASSATTQTSPQPVASPQTQASPQPAQTTPAQSTGEGDAPQT